MSASIQTVAEGAQGQPESLPLDLLRAGHRLQGRQSPAQKWQSSKWRCRSVFTRGAKSPPPAASVSKDGVIGLLDVPDTFLDPDRMRAGLLWFTRGFVEYQFPNNAKLCQRQNRRARACDGAFLRGPGHIEGLALRHHGRDQRPGDRHLDLARRLSATSAARLTPDWWKLAGSQYGDLKHWRITPNGTYRDGAKVSPARWPTSSSTATARSGYASASRKMPATPAASTSSAAASAITARTSCCAC